MNKNEMIEEMAKIVDEMYNVYTTTAENIAEGLYNVCYRKIDDDCAVITKAELKQYKAQAVKEFAEMLKNKYGKSCSEYYPMLIEITSDDIDNLLKDYEK